MGAGNRVRVGRTQQNMLIAEMRRAKVLALVETRLYSVDEIAHECETSPSTIQRDLKVIRQRANDRSIDIFDSIAERELSKLRRFQAKIERAFDRSCADEQTVEQEAAPGTPGRLVLTKKKIRTQSGSSGLASTWVSAQRLICEIEGMIGTDRFEGQVVDQTPKLLRVVVQSREEAQRYESLRLEQVERMGIIEGTAKPSAGHTEGEP